MKDYLRRNLIAGLKTSPLRVPLRVWALLPLFLLIAAPIGFGAGLLKLDLLNSPMAPLLPLTLFVFPSLLEEAFFRGLLIPRNILQAGKARVAWVLVLSTVAFVAWHPLNALTINPSANPLFMDPWFLLIVTVLGLICGYSYMLSRCLWVPVIIHWATVTLWVLFFGGRNLVLES